MKGILILISIITVGLYSCSQEIPASKVPSVVQNTVKTTFTNVIDIDWEKKSELYEAEFDLDKTEYKARIDAAGKLVMYKSDIPVTELPSVIAGVISSEHAGYAIDDVEKLVKDGVTYYQVELDARGKKEKHLVYTADGKPALNIDYMS